MRKAISIGINDYPNAELKGAISDGISMKEILETNGDGSPNFDVSLFTDIKSKADLKRVITNLFIGDPEIALLYFSGHGFFNERGGYLVTPDYCNYDEGVSMDEILKLCNKSNAKNKAIILDCCHSGAFGSKDNDEGATLKIKGGVTILTASGADESAFEEGGQGIFTRLLLDAFKGGAADLRGNVTAGSIYAYIDQSLSPWDQRPVFKTNIKKFCPLRQVTPQVPTEKLRKLIEYFPTPTYEFPLSPKFEYTAEGAELDKIAIFKDLQKYAGVGLVIPNGEEHLYWAAINSKSCKLTSLGFHYWRLITKKRI